MMFDVLCYCFEKCRKFKTEKHGFNIAVSTVDRLDVIYTHKVCMRDFDFSNSARTRFLPCPYSSNETVITLVPCKVLHRVIVLCPCH